MILSSRPDSTRIVRPWMAGVMIAAAVAVGCHARPGDGLPGNGGAPQASVGDGAGADVAPQAGVEQEVAPGIFITPGDPACGNPCQVARYEGADFSPKPPIQPLPPEESAARMILEPGYRVEPVLTEPRIASPAAIEFDGNGRMYVLELRSYMRDAHATDELAPINRISRWEDLDNDGVYETGTVFVDGLVFPRFVLALTDGVILTKESNSGEIWMYTDIDGDGVADRREIVATNFGRSANVEHQESHLTWALDNWMYASYESVRLRWTPDGIIREPIGNPGGAWGVTQDDDGKIWVQAGASGLPGYFQFPIHYGNFAYDDEVDPALRYTWGAPIGIADMQGGMPEVRMPDGSLLRTTAGAGNDIFRGHRLPEELRGQYFYGEVVARIVRRVVPTKFEGLTRLSNAYEGQEREFIASLDPLFRPVDMATAPDGTMYIVDMYHGIIQQGIFAPPGSYLYAKIKQYQLDRIVDHGRIWRLTHDGIPRDTVRPRMYEETTAELVRHLEHPNGWWRDMAQRQIVLRQDRSVAPALREMARGSANILARFHALWSLEGLGVLDAELVREFLRDPDPRARIQGLRASETLYKAGDRSFAADYEVLARDEDPEVVAHALMTLNVLGVANARAIVEAVKAENGAAAVQHVAGIILAPREVAGGGGTWTDEERALILEGEAIYRGSCAECHGERGLGVTLAGQALAPPLAGSPGVNSHREYVIRVLLHGMSGPVNGKEYAGTMIPFGSVQSDEWIAAVASYIRTSFTNGAGVVTPEQVAAVRAASQGVTGTWTQERLRETVPTPIRPDSSWVITASHNAPIRHGASAEPARAFTLEGWTTGVPQEPGMWFQVDMGRPARLTEIEFTSPNPEGGAPGSTPVGRLMTAPRSYELRVSADGSAWETVATGGSDTRRTVITFQPVEARYVRLELMGRAPDDAPWSMTGLTIYHVAVTPE